MFYHPEHADWALIDANTEIIDFGRDDLSLCKEAEKIPKFLALGMASMSEIPQVKDKEVFSVKSMLSQTFNTAYYFFKEDDR